MASRTYLWSILNYSVVNERENRKYRWAKGQKFRIAIKPLQIGRNTDSPLTRRPVNDWTNISDYASIHHVYRKIRKKKPSFNSHNKYQVEKGFGRDLVGKGIWKGFRGAAPPSRLTAHTPRRRMVSVKDLKRFGPYPANGSHGPS
jgi:hypothetical protein